MFSPAVAANPTGGYSMCLQVKHCSATCSPLQNKLKRQWEFVRDLLEPARTATTQHPTVTAEKKTLPYTPKHFKRLSTESKQALQLSSPSQNYATSIRQPYLTKKSFKRASRDLKSFKGLAHNSELHSFLFTVLHNRLSTPRACHAVQSLSQSETGTLSTLFQKGPLR